MKLFVTLTNRDRLGGNLTTYVRAGLTRVCTATFDPSTCKTNARLPLEEFLRYSKSICEGASLPGCGWYVSAVEAEISDPNEGETKLLAEIDRLQTENAQLSMSLRASLALGASAPSSGEPERTEQPSEPSEEGDEGDNAEHDGITSAQLFAKGFRELRMMAQNHQVPGYSAVTKKDEMVLLLWNHFQKHQPVEA